MSIEYEAAYRPNFERQLAFIWATGGMTSFLAMTAVTGLPILPSAALSSVFFAAAGYQATFAVKHRRRFEALQRRHRNFYGMDELADEMQGGALFMGRGFAWAGNMAQKVSDILRDPDLVKSLRGNRDGATYLHGVGYDEEAPIYLRDDESKGKVEKSVPAVPEGAAAQVILGRRCARDIIRRPVLGGYMTQISDSQRMSSSPRPTSLISSIPLEIMR